MGREREEGTAGYDSFDFYFAGEEGFEREDGHVGQAGAVEVELDEVQEVVDGKWEAEAVFLAGSVDGWIDGAVADSYGEIGRRLSIMV